MYDVCTDLLVLVSKFCTCASISTYAYLYLYTIYSTGIVFIYLYVCTWTYRSIELIRNLISRDIYGLYVGSMLMMDSVNNYDSVLYLVVFCLFLF